MSSRFNSTTSDSTIKTGTENSTDTPEVIVQGGSNVTVPDTSSSILAQTTEGTSTPETDNLSTNTATNIEVGTTVSAMGTTPGTTSVSPQDEALGVTSPLDGQTQTPPIPEPPITVPMSTSEILMQNPHLAINTGPTSGLSLLQQQALKTIGDLSKPHEGHTPLVGTSVDVEQPAGYYTVAQGWIRSKGQRLDAKTIGGRYYFDPDDLDAKAIKQLDAMVKDGSAVLVDGQSGNSN